MGFVRYLMYLLLVLFVAASITGCTQLNRTQNVKVTATKKPSVSMPTTTPPKVNNTKATQVFFYYSSECSVCRNVKPYMDLIRKTDSNKVAFYYCNVARGGNCSKYCIWVAKHINLNNKPLPYVIIIHGRGVYMETLEGLNAVKTAFILHEFGLPIPNATLNGTNYSTALCLRCHLKMGFLPKKYTCTYCCHLSSKANNTAINNSIKSLKQNGIQYNETNKT